MHILGSHGESAAPVQAAESKYAQQHNDVMAFQQHLVTEAKVICPANRYEQPSARKAAVNGLDVRKDLPASRIRQFTTMVAEDKHERLIESLLNDAAVGSAINIDPRLAPGIVMAEIARRLRRRTNAQTCRAAACPAGP